VFIDWLFEMKLPTVRMQLQLQLFFYIMQRFAKVQ
jgi:hypothetical protein